MKKPIRTILWGLLALALVSGMLYLRGDIGMARGRIAEDVRRDLPGGEVLHASFGEELAAVLVATNGAPSLRIYVNRPGLSFGWFFRYGGPASEGTVQCFSPERGGERVYAAACDHGVTTVSTAGGEILFPVTEAPFVLVLPANAGAEFYDAAGNRVSVIDRSL